MGKFQGRRVVHPFYMPFASIIVSFFLFELFSVCYLQPWSEGFEAQLLWPLSFGVLWALILGCFVRVFPWKAGRVVYGILYLLSLIYAVGQTGYYQLFQEMMWLSEFLYASEGADYLDVILSYPASWFFWIAALTALGLLTLWKFPRWKRTPGKRIWAAFV